MPECRPHYAGGMTDMLICDFIQERDDERPPRHVVGEATGWELVIFELMDDDDG